MSFSGWLGHYLGAGLRAIGEGHLDFGCVCDDVQAGEDIAAVVDHHAAAQDMPTFPGVHVGGLGPGLDEDKRGLDSLVGAHRKGRGRRGRGHRLGHGVTHLARSDLVRAGKDGVIKQEGGESGCHARRERHEAAKAG